MFGLMHYFIRPHACECGFGSQVSSRTCLENMSIHLIFLHIYIHVKLLNRVVTWDNEKGLICEADPRHVEIFLKQLPFTEAKFVTTPGAKDEGNNSEDHEAPVEEGEATNYRALVARCDYFSPGRPDIAHTVTELARSLSKPTRGDFQRFKRLARYLNGRPRMVARYKGQPMQTAVVTYSDVAWAGCRNTMKSTTRVAST